jgi:hypothetical protein
MSVKIIASKNNNVFEPTKKEGLFCLAVEEVQPNATLSLNSKFAQAQSRRIAFIFRTKEQFDAIFAAMNVTPAAGTELEGIVAIKEQLEPFSATNPAAGIKYPNAAAKAAGLSCTFQGKPIYRDTFYTTDVDVEDVLIAHDNGADIQAFVAKMNAGTTKAATSTLSAASPTGTGRGRKA